MRTSHFTSFALAASLLAVVQGIELRSLGATPAFQDQYPIDGLAQIGILNGPDFDEEQKRHDKENELFFASMKEANEEYKMLKKMTHKKPKRIVDNLKKDERILEKELASYRPPPQKKNKIVTKSKTKKDQELDLLVASDPLVPVSNWYNDEIKQVRLSELPDLIEVHPFYEGEDKEFLLKCRAKQLPEFEKKWAKEREETERFENGKIRRHVTKYDYGQGPERLPKEHSNYDKWEDRYGTIYEDEFKTTDEEAAAKKKNIEAIKQKEAADKRDMDEENLKKELKRDKEQYLRDRDHDAYMYEKGFYHSETPKERMTRENNEKQRVQNENPSPFLDKIFDGMYKMSRIINGNGSNNLKNTAAKKRDRKGNVIL